MRDYRQSVRIGDPAVVTVRKVANHTAGLPLHYQFFYEDEPYRAPSRDETILRYGNTVTAPGERDHYSNLGYGIIDYAISRVSGKSYRDFMRTEVFVRQVSPTCRSTSMPRCRSSRPCAMEPTDCLFRSIASTIRVDRRFTPARTTWSGSACSM